jgi:uncharacterized repeat protein (TIGR01451 family)
MKANLLLIGLFLLSISKFDAFAQGNVSAVSPSVGNLNSNVTLQISGANTVFTQATSNLYSSIDHVYLMPTNNTLTNGTTITSAYSIPDDPYYVGYWDVNAGNAAPLTSGFYIQPNAVVLKGYFYLDSDANCIYDPTETRYNNYYGFTVTVQPGNITVPITIDGRYAVELPLGSYAATVQINPPSNWPYTSGLCSTLQSIYISAPNPELVYGPNFGLSFNHIKGTVYVDRDNNCVMSANEVKLSGGYVKYVASNTTWSSIQPDGTYDIPLPVGTNNGNVELIIPNYFYNTNWGNVTCPASGNIPVTFPNFNPTIQANNNFGLTMNDTCTRLVSRISMNGSRPCFSQSTHTNVYNISPFTAYNVETEITLDSRLTINSLSMPASMVNGNVYTFTFDSIPAFQHKGIYFYTTVACNAVVGDSLYSKINTTYSPAACVDSMWSFDDHKRRLTLSYDPNNKETPSHISAEIAPNDALDYMINFQNTGTDTAFTVTLIDTLPSQLIPTSLIPLSSSHNYTYYLMANNVVKFLFHQINLPDSATDQEGSKGFIRFIIKQTQNNPQGTIIKNKAGIYFDFNAPIITNNTYNIIPLVTSEVQSFVEGDVNVMPNPFSDITKFVFNNKSKNTKATISIFDVTGKLVDEVKNIGGNSYEYKNDQLTEQLYFYKVVDEEKQLGVGKLIIKK